MTETQLPPSPTYSQIYQAAFDHGVRVEREGIIKLLQQNYDYVVLERLIAIIRGEN